MKIPSLRSQLIFFVVIALVGAVLFFRFFFLQSLSEHQLFSNQQSVEIQLSQIYEKYEDKLLTIDNSEFKNDIESIIKTEKQQLITDSYFQKEVELYSIFIITFLVIIVFGLILFSFYFITRPIQKLQDATIELSKGRLDVVVQESNLSPLNSLIISFNTMIKDLKYSQHQLLKAEKEVVWRETARAMAHEIKNPLTPIRLSLDRLQTKLLNDDLSKVCQQSINIVNEEVENLQKLASEFSEFARLPKAHKSKSDIVVLVENMCKTYQNDVDISLEIIGNSQQVVIDEFQIKQVLTNLIQNSIQANANEILLILEFSQNTWSLVIKDNGKGIPTENLPFIFEPYFSQKKKGTGLGLAIVRQIIENHSGKITVKSELNKSTQFTITMEKYD
jgi:two-component system, NtrC family, nitrogen regulation sensor histidine kinase NtrY